MNTINKALKIVDKKQKKKLIILFFFSLIAVFLELLGIGIIFPFLTSIVSEESFSKYNLKFLDDFLLKNNFNVEIFFLSLILIIFFIKNSYLFFQLKYQSKIIYEVAENLSSKLFRIYLNLDIINFKLRNTSTLVRNTTTEINTFCSGCVNSFINILTEVFLLTSILIFLIFIDIKLTLVSLSLIVTFSSLIYFSLKKKIFNLGKLRQSSESGRLQYLNQGFGSIKDIKLSGNEDKFLEDFNLRNQNSLKSTREYFVLSNLPRLILEFVGILVFLIIFLILINQAENSKDILPQAGIFFIAFFRMMPSANKILISFQALNFAKVSIELIEKELSDSKISGHKFNKLDKKDLLIKNNISIENICFRYNKNNPKYDLSNINFKAKRGEIIGLTGPSGSGKSTLIDLILGFYSPDEGNIKFDEKKINLNLSSWQHLIGYVPQSIFLIDSSIKENIILSDSSKNIDEERLNYAIEKSELSSFINSLDLKLDTIVGERGARISGGQLQRIGIARALYKKSQLLIFDEATNALDKSTENSILETIYQLKQNYTSIIVSHDKDCLKICDQILTLDNGKIING